MAEMGKYCKAYLAKDFRQFQDWTENLDNLRPEEETVRFANFSVSEVMLTN